MEFVFAIPNIFSYEQPHVMITTSLEIPVFTTLSIPGTQYEIHSNVTKYKSADMILSQEVVGTDLYMHSGDGLQANKTIIVSSSYTVGVHFIIDDYCCNDGTAVFPSSQLGKRYVIASYRPRYSPYPSFFCVSSLYENTSVNITTSDGRLVRVLLSQYASYRFDGIDSEDLSGTQLESDKPIAVISGSRPSISDETIYDGIVSFLPSIESWGYHHILTPLQSLIAGYVYRVFAMNINTMINVSDSNMITLQPGEYYEGDVSGDTLIKVASDQPVMVVQYFKKEPSMLIVPPITSFADNNVTFPVMTYTNYGHTYHINIVSECRYTNDFILDDNIRINDWEQFALENMCCIRGQVATGTHTVSRTNPLATFFVFVYALGFDSSYAYSAHSYFEKGRCISNATH